MKLHKMNNRRKCYISLIYTPGIPLQDSTLTLCRLLPYCKPFRNSRVNGRNKHLYCFQVSPSGTESLDIPPGICRNGS